jgi:mono/diheme cytochrome c family protein
MTRGMWITLGALGSVALAALILWDAQVHRIASAGAAPDLGAPIRIADGRRVYEAHCASCHGAELEGQPDWTSRRPDGRLPAPPHDDSGHTWHHPSEQLFGLTKHGLVPPNAPPGYASDMPAFAGVLSDDEIWNVLAYIRSRWSPAVRARQDQLEAQVRAQRGQANR